MRDHTKLRAFELADEVAIRSMRNHQQPTAYSLNNLSSYEWRRIAMMILRR